MDGKSKDILENGVHAIRLSLEANAFDFLRTYHELDYRKISDLKIKIISLIGFYECFIKWAMALKSKELIWDDNKKEFSEKDFEAGNFYSKKLSKCLIYAQKENWLDKEEKEFVGKYEDIRNRIVHFAFVGDFVILDSNAIEIDYSDFDKHDLIIAKLIARFENNFTRIAFLDSNDLVEYYKSLIK